MDDKLAYEIGLSLAKGMNAKTALELLRRIPSPESFFKLTYGELASLTGVLSPIFDDAYRRDLLEQAKKEADFVRLNKVRTFFIGSAEYPRRLAECDDAPVMLYALGDFDINNPHNVGVVGTRHATPYGLSFTSKLVDDLARMLPGVGIASGLAFGIDVAAHKAALAAGTPTVAVLGHGLHMIYPAEHRSIAVKIIEQGGMLLTEYASGVKINRNNFLRRNRIVASMSDALVVVESDYKGGSMSTARMASLYNRDVFALPGRTTDVYSRGTNSLIANHTAQLITSAADLARHMGWQAVEQKTEEPPSPFESLTPQMKALVEFITANPDATVNDMCVRLGEPYAVISDRLFKLELEDLIISIPGGRYALNATPKHHRP